MYGGKNYTQSLEAGIMWDLWKVVACVCMCVHNGRVTMNYHKRMT